MPRKQDDHYSEQPVDQRMLELKREERVCTEADRWVRQTRALLSSLTSDAGQLQLSPEDVLLWERMITRVGDYHSDAWSRHRELLFAPSVFVDNDEGEVS